MSQPVQQRQEVRILIIAKDLQQFKKHAQFLTRRGFPCDVVPGIKQAVEYVVKHRPMFVMVSFSIPTASITKLPNLLQQTFNANCIAFGEMNDMKTKKRLSQCKLKNIFHGAMSGPSIHMRIKKILMEMEKEKQQKNNPQRQNTPAPAAPPVQPAQAQAQQQQDGDVIARGQNERMREDMLLDPNQANASMPEDGGEGYWGDKKKKFGQNAETGSYNYQGEDRSQSAFANNDGSGMSADEEMAAAFANMDGADASGPAVGSYQPDQAMSDQQASSFNPQDQGGDFAPAGGGNGPGMAAQQAAMNNNMMDSDAGGPAVGSYQPNQAMGDQQTDSFNPQDQGGDFAPAEGNGPRMAAQQAAMNNNMMDSDAGGPAVGSYQPDQAMSDQQASSFNPQDQGGDFAPAGNMDPAAMGDQQAGSFDANQEDDFAPAGNMDPAVMDDQQAGSFNPQDQNGDFAPAGNMDPAAMGDQQAGSFDANQEDDFAPAGNMDPAEMDEQQPAEFNPQDQDDAQAAGNMDSEMSAAMAAMNNNEEGANDEAAAAPRAVAHGLPDKPASAPAQAHSMPDRIPNGSNKLNNTSLSDMAKAFDQIFREQCEESAVTPVPIREVDTVGVITIKSETTNGYLLFAAPENASLDERFLESMKISMQNSLKNDLLEFYLAESFQTEIKRVSFIEWASATADFISTHMHDEKEMAMAYFSADAVPYLQSVEGKENMLAVNIDAVKANVSLGFHGYINFEKNNKMLLYFKKGRSLSQEQKDRLKKKNVADIFIPEDEKEIFCMQMAESHVNQLIESYFNYVRQLRETTANLAS